MEYFPNRVPANMLEPIDTGEFHGYPVTVEMLLVRIAELEGLVEGANARFSEISKLQEK